MGCKLRLVDPYLQSTLATSDVTRASFVKLAVLMGCKHRLAPPPVPAYAEVCVCVCVCVWGGGVGSQ